MPLSEPQIVRYSRQILLPEVGGAGQERLLARGALATGTGAAQATALAYLAAGGTPVAVRDRAVDASETGFLLTADEVGRPLSPSLRGALLDANPDSLVPASDRGRLAELPGSFHGPGPWVALGWSGDEGVVLWRNDRGCEGCFEASCAELSNGPAGAQAVLLGAMGALAFQRCVLGLAADLGGVRLAEDGSIAGLELSRCAAHASGHR
ncbi:MAG: ThiF family adenylyltransferase [Myxococcales bacterium]|nr:ThiF family adenylyltransferase [Myxococcales bacterium]